MTYADDIPPPTGTTAAPGSRWETCDHCQAPLDERQRYCVACGSRRAQADDPVARYFVASARRARGTSGPATVASSPSPGIKVALLLALLPVAAGIGVVVGRNANNGDELLLEALKAQKAPVVNVGAGGAAAPSDETANASSDKQTKGGGSDPADGEVIGRGAYGTARKLTGAKVTPEQLAESKEALEKIVSSKGKEYVESQRDLPDQIIIP